MPTNAPRAFRLRRTPAAMAALGGSILVGTLAVWVAGDLGGDQATGWASDWIQLATMVMACAAATLAASSTRRGRTGWAFIAAAVGCWILAQAIWIPVNNGTLHDPAASTALGLLFLMGTPLLALGSLYLFTQGLTPQGAYRRLLDAFLVVGGLVVLLWYAFLEDATSSLGGADPVTIGFTIVYPIGDAVILGLVAALFPGMDRQLRRRLAPVAASLVLIAFADLGFAYVTAQGNYTSGNYFDVGWSAAEVILCVTALTWARSRPESPPRRHGTSYSFSQLIPALAALTLTLVDFASGSPTGAFPLYMGGALFVALSLRQGLHASEMRQTAQHLQEAFRRERVARDASAKSEAKLLVAQKIAAVGFWESDARKETATLSPEMVDLVGIGQRTQPASPIPVQLLLKALPDQDRDAFAAAWNEALTTRRSMTLEHRLASDDGKTRWARTRFEPRPDGNGSHALFAVTHEITDLKMAEAARAEVHRLAEVNEFRTQLLNVASHELNTPIGAVKLQLHILKLKLRNKLPAETASALAILDRNVERLAALVADTLDVARIQSGKLPVHVRPTALDSMVAEVLETFAPLARRQGVKIETRVEPGVLAAADPKRITQVLFNLVSNALKFTPKGGTVTISGELTEGRARLAVADTGTGLTPEQIAQLFKPFAQVHAGEVVSRGTGLGLFISRGIVEQHAGTIWCESPGLGRGSRFIVELPAGHAPPLAPVAVPATA